MGRHWIEELINTLAGNSRYVRYPVRTQWLVLLAIIVFLLMPLLRYGLIESPAL